MDRQRPVSYTHLDVYKRQIKVRPLVFDDHNVKCIILMGIIGAVRNIALLNILLFHQRIKIAVFAQNQCPDLTIVVDDLAVFIGGSVNVQLQGCLLYTSRCV